MASQLTEERAGACRELKLSEGDGEVLEGDREVVRGDGEVLEGDREVVGGDREVVGGNRGRMSLMWNSK